MAAVATAAALLLTGSVAASAAVATPDSAAAPAKRKKPGDGVAGSCDAASITPGASPRARYLWIELRSAGYSPEATAGVIGVLDYRSALAPMAISEDWSGYGIAQWPTDRWQSYNSWADEYGYNRWSPKRQVEWLIEEMAANPESFDSTAFATATDPAAASATFRQSFFPAPADPAALGDMASRARSWLSQLAGTALTEMDPALTNGIRVPCLPASGAVLDRCPDMPQAYQSAFKSFTGYTWTNLDSNAEMMSRCVYANFPYIQSQGTYAGHMPVWSQAIDFFMPYGCTYRNGHAVTRSKTDLLVGKRLARYLITNGDRFGLDYMIFQDHIRNPDEHPDENQWRQVSNWRRDNYNNGDCVNTHFDHLHASVYKGDGWAASTTPKPALNPDGKPW